MAPPPPTISQTLSSIPTGYTFSFFFLKPTQLQGTGSKTVTINGVVMHIPATPPQIMGYAVYRSSTNVTPTSPSALYKFVPQNGSTGLVNTAGAHVFQDANAGSGSVFYYWLSSVGTNGAESNLVNCQTGTVTSTAIYTPIGNLTSGTLLGGDNGVSANGPASGSGKLGLGGIPTKGIHILGGPVGVHQYYYGGGTGNPAGGLYHLDGNPSGVLAAWGSGIDTVGVISHQRAGTTRYFLNGTGHGFDVTPAYEIHGAGVGIGLMQNSGSVQWAVKDTSVSGVDANFWNNVNGGSVGVLNIVRAGSLRYFLPASGHGFDGTPSFSSGTGIHVLNNRCKVTGSDAIYWADDTQASGVLGWFTSGDAAAGTISIARASNTRYQLNSTGHGFEMTPGQTVDITGSRAQISGNSTGWKLNNTGVSGRNWELSAGEVSSNAEVGITDNTAGATRLQSDNSGSGQWGIQGSPSFPLDVAAGGAAAIRATGAAPSLRVDDTNSSGRKYDFVSGIVSAGQFNITDQTAGSARIKMDSSGNIDLAGATPVSGFITAGGGKVSDTSGNLQLKNVVTATGTTTSPSTTSTSFATIAEMTITKTFKGNPVIIVFTAPLNLQTMTGTNQLCSVAIFKDGSQLSQEYQFTCGFTGTSTVVTNYELPFVVSYLDQPTAASHTYTIQWRITNTGPTLFNLGTARTMQIVELG
ncbi:MAG TPA: hypothetical protein VGR55_00475 [Candidatus Acidoferrum sp.]|nr:hypothetical protein [Candidatus Acidoferrum sp.]